MEKDCYSCGKAGEEIRKDEVFNLQRLTRSTHVEEDVRTFNFDVDPPTENIVQYVREWSDSDDRMLIQQLADYNRQIGPVSKRQT